MTIRLQDFLCYGALDKIGLGTPRSHVLKVLKYPIQWGREKRVEEAEIWKYDSLEISFRKDRITLIGIYFDDRKYLLPKELGQFEEIDESNFFLQKFETFLKEYKLNYEENKVLTMRNQYCLKVESCANVFFKISDFNLSSIQCAVYSS